MPIKISSVLPRSKEMSTEDSCGLKGMQKYFSDKKNEKKIYDRETSEVTQP